MKILIVSQAIYPRLSPRAHRATELAKEFSRQGHEVTLSACLGTYDYSEFQTKNNIKVKNLGVSPYQWITSDKDSRNISLWRKGVVFFLRKLFLFPDILLVNRIAKFMKNSDDFDLIITVAIPYPIHWGMTKAKRKYPHLANTKWISDCGDPFMGNPFSKHPFYFKWVEKWWCRTTDYIAIPTEDARTGYYPEFLDKICVIPQGFVFDDSVLAEYKDNPIPTFAYSGMVYPEKRDPRSFLEYLAESGKDFHFVVYTNKPAFFAPYKEKLGDKLEMREYVPREVLLHELSKMDFLINIRNESAVQAPSKLIDYYLTHRPILEITSTFQEAENFEAFCKKDYSAQINIENPERFNIKNVCHEFANL